MQNTATTYNDGMVDPAYVSSLIKEDKRQEQLKQKRTEEVERTRNSKNMAEVGGAKRALKNKAKTVVKKKIEGVVERKIICGTPFLSALYGAYAFFVNITTADKKKKIDFDMWDWLALIASNIKMIVITIAGLTIIVMIVDFMEGNVIEKTMDTMRFFIFEGGITKINWSTIKALFSLF